MWPTKPTVSTPSSAPPGNSTTPPPKLRTTTSDSPPRAPPSSASWGRGTPRRRPPTLRRTHRPDLGHTRNPTAWNYPRTSTGNRSPPTSDGTTRTASGTRSVRSNGGNDFARGSRRTSARKAVAVGVMQPTHEPSTSIIPIRTRKNSRSTRWSRWGTRRRTSARRQTPASFSVRTATRRSTPVTKQVLRQLRRRPSGSADGRPGTSANGGADDARRETHRASSSIIPARSALVSVDSSPIVRPSHASGRRSSDARFSVQTATDSNTTGSGRAKATGFSKPPPSF